VRGDHITLVKNPNYFKKGLPYLDKLVFRFIPDQSTLFAGLKSGSVDYVPDGVPFALVDELNKDSGFNPVPIRTTSIGQTLRIFFNLDTGPTTNVKVRQAISLAIDRQTIVTKVAHDWTKVAKSVFPDTPNMAQYRSPNVPVPTQDLATAEKLLDDAGYKRGSDGVRFTLGKFLISTGEESFNSEPAALIKDMLKKVGIETTIVAVDESTKYNLIWSARPRGFDIAMVRLKAGPDPYFTVKFFTSAWIIKGFAVNDGYNNSNVDKLYDQIRNSQSTDQQVQLFRQVDEILNRDLPETWIFDIVYAQPRRNTFQGSSFYDIISESGPIESIYWTQGSPITPASVTTTTSPTQAPTLPWEWMATLVVVIIVLGGVYLTLTRRKKKT
jgi:peptide/nickel transport system substrate-binding protein